MMPNPARCPKCGGCHHMIWVWLNGIIIIQCQECYWEGLYMELITEES